MGLKYVWLFPLSTMKFRKCLLLGLLLSAGLLLHMFYPASIDQLKAGTGLSRYLVPNETIENLFTKSKSDDLNIICRTVHPGTASTVESSDLMLNAASLPELAGSLLSSPSENPSYLSDNTTFLPTTTVYSTITSTPTLSCDEKILTLSPTPCPVSTHFVTETKIVTSSVTVTPKITITATQITTKTVSLVSTPDRDEKTTSNPIQGNISTSVPVKKNIFFMETSGKTVLNARQACSIESAAKENPDMNVILYITNTTVDISDPIMAALISLPNLYIKYLDLKSYFIGTALEKWYKDGKWKKSPFKISHTSDALRFLVLWKYGGAYLDLDVVVLKSLRDLRNCAGRESKAFVVPGVMMFDKGHKFLSLCLEEFAKNYRYNNWGYNGPDLFTRVLKRVCGNITDLNKVKPETCLGVTALPINAFYAIPWQKWKLFFDAANAKEVMKKWKDSYLIHVWNKHSASTKVTIGSGQPYELAAKQHCPTIYKVMTPLAGF